MKKNNLQKNIPQGWVETELGNSEYFNVLPSGINKFDGIKKYLSTSSVNEKGIISVESEINFKERPSRANMQPALNSVWFAKMKDTLKVLEINNKQQVDNYILSTGFAGIKCKDNVISKFLKQIILSDNFNNKKNTKAKGSTQKAININELGSIRVLLPPVKEQQKIAKILGAVDEDIEKTDEVIRATEKLKKGLMQDVFSFKNKEDVKYLTLGDIGKVSMCKRVFKKETSNTGDIPFYKIGTFGKAPDSFISQELFDSYRNKFSFPKIGDILLSASGTIGRKVKYDGKPAYFQDSNIIWLEHNESKVLNSFLFYIYDMIKWETEGSTIKRLYNNIFLKKIIPVPSVNKQKQIVKILSAVDEKILINKKLKEELILLKKGLMQDLLSGKVRV